MNHSSSDRVPNAKMSNAKDLLYNMQAEMEQAAKRKAQHNSNISLTASIDHQEHAQARKQEIKNELDASLVNLDTSLNKKIQQCVERKVMHLDTVKTRAKQTLKTVKQRQELDQAITDSSRALKAHQTELKRELAEANRNDILAGIKEKQQHLQNF